MSVQPSYTEPSSPEHPVEPSAAGIAGARIGVLGVGGGGGNAVAHMIASSLEGVRYLAANTDVQALQNVGGAYRLALGENLTGGLGAGANPNVGHEAAKESLPEIRKFLDGLDMLFLTAGMGGGTGTGASPVIAEAARSMGILTVAVVTRPFSMIEGPKRANYAEQGIQALKEHTDSLIIIPNDSLMPELGESATLLKAFSAANDVLYNAVAGIARMITSPGLINIDFADVKAVMAAQGNAKVGTGVGTGEMRARDAALQAINSPLLEYRYVEGALTVMVNIAGGEDIGLGEFNEVGEIVQAIAADDATIIVGTSIDHSLLDGAIKVTVVAAGLPDAPPHAASSVTRERAQESVAPARGAAGGINPGQMVGGTASSPAPAPATSHSDADYLDIPAFLRRPTNR